MESTGTNWGQVEGCYEMSLLSKDEVEGTGSCFVEDLHQHISFLPLHISAMNTSGDRFSKALWVNNGYFLVLSEAHKNIIFNVY